VQVKKIQQKRIKRNVNGVLLLDKPLGYSSNQALQKIKWLYQAEKAGHTGTLDPLATGLLPICLGEATKFAQYLTDADKSYIATIKLGVTTTTGDAEGEVVESRPVDVTRQRFEGVCQQFLGEISQVPPMYSALKHEGKALYEYARKGMEIERKARQVQIMEIATLRFEGSVAKIAVTCSKGTYIRMLAEDIGRELACGAHLIALRRTATAGYELNEAYTLDQIEAMTLEQRDKNLMPVDSAIDDLPKVELSEDQAYYLLQGQAIWKAGKVPAGDCRLYDQEDRFIGLGYLQDDGKIAPKRLLQKPN
jgi:tRNA pseudouridine55 synthase